MKGEPKWISKQAVLAIHERLLAEHGGLPGLVEEGPLDTALASPVNHYHYDKADLFTLAAAYAHALIRDHPFRDGNKRIALTVAGVFLELNGYRLIAPEQEAVLATSSLADRSLDLTGYTAWLRDSSVKASSPRTRARKRKPDKSLARRR